MPSKKTNNIFTNPSLALITSGLLYSLYGPLTRITGESFGAITQTSIRSGLRILILLPIVLIFSKNLKKIDSNHWKWFGFIGLAAATTNIFYVLAITKLSMGTTMFLFYALGTVSAFIVGKLLYKEKLNAIKFVSLTLALAGVLLMFLDKLSLGSNLTYLFSAIIAGLSYGIYVSFSKKVSSDYSRTQMIFIIAAIEIPIYLFSLSFFREVSTWDNPISWLSNVVYAILIIINSYLIFYGYKHLEAQKASILLLSELIFIVVLGVIVYHEIPTIKEIIGSILILSSLILPNLNIVKRRL